MPSAISVLVWFNPRIYASSAGILEKRSPSVFGGYGLVFNREGNQRVTWVVMDEANTWYMLHSASIIPLNTFTFIAGTFDGTNSKLYINGKLEAGRTAIMTTNTAILTIGRASPAPHAHFPGIIALVRIFNRALSDSEIKTIYEAEKVLFQ